MFVVVGSKGKRYGHYIGNNPEAVLSISAAILWTSVVAKTIELTFCHRLRSVSEPSAQSKSSRREQQPRDDALRTDHPALGRTA